MKKILVICCFVLLSACQNSEEEKFLGMANYADDEKCHIGSSKKGTEPVFFILISLYQSGEISHAQLSEEAHNAIDRGCDIDERLSDIHKMKGFTPLHLAIINAQEDIVSLYLDNGADKNLTINNPSNSKIHGKNAIELSEIVLKKDDSDNRQKIHQLLLNK